MPKVYNWHLGRDMDYPYANAHSRQQFVFVVNLNRCAGCHTCSVACKSTWTFSPGQELMWWNNVETKPYGGHPQLWDVKTLSMLDDVHSREGISPTWDTTLRNETRPYGTYYGLTLIEAAAKTVGEGPQEALGYLPTDEEWRLPNIREDTAASGRPNANDPRKEKVPAEERWFFYLPRQCNHCDYPACLAACPRKAIYKRPQDGVVLIDQRRCRGYRKCISACPYKKAVFRPNTRISEKCVGCYPLLEGKDPDAQGQPLQTRCTTACPGKARIQGLVGVNGDGQWAEDPDNPLYCLIRQEEVALPLYPQFGTQPGGYYIPPLWAPRDYLQQMFGPGVVRALDAYRAPTRRLLAILQLFGVTRSVLSKYKIIAGKKILETTIAGKPWAMYDDTAVGYGADGRKLVSVKVEEPFWVRPEKYLDSV